jgi:hypothetical protein
MTLVRFAVGLVCAVQLKAILAVFHGGVKEQRSATGHIEKDIHISSVSSVRPAIWCRLMIVVLNG